MLLLELIYLWLEFTLEQIIFEYISRTPHLIKLVSRISNEV